jgi:choline dehydrogenase-like flavoprotein
MKREFDYVVVGGGSAGCVIAARLSEDADARVCLLEAGGPDRNILIHWPVGFAKMTTGPLTWGMKTAPQVHALGREIPYVQAKVLGGGSSINAEIFTRGHASDFDRWEQEGAQGWSFKDVQPYFLKSEGNTVLSGRWHGADGPLGVSTLAQPNPASLAFVRSCQELGMPHNADFSGAFPEGAGIYQTTIRDNRRCSAAVAYLRPASGRPNLVVLTGVHARRIEFEGARAVGVEFEQGGAVASVRAEREVILTAGAIGSPKLLMVSGVGPADDLQEVGVDVRHDLPGVGQNLTDHFGVDIVAELRDHDSLDKYNKPHWMVWAGLQYLLFRSGPVTSNVVEAGAFWYAGGSASPPVPDLQFHFLAGAGAEAGVATVPEGSSGITLNSYTLRPRSRGSVTLRSPDPRVQPLVDPNFLADPDDLRISMAGVRISRDIFNQPSLRKLIRKVRFPDDSVRSDADLAGYVRRYGRTSYHPTCTCRIGSDPLAVVDAKLRVHGLDGLRVCDSSVMPSLIGSNTNATTIMIGERAADFIRGNR